MEIPDIYLTLHENPFLSCRWLFEVCVLSRCSYLSEKWAVESFLTVFACTVCGLSEDRHGQGDSLCIPFRYCINLKGRWSVIGDSSDTENTDQRRGPPTHLAAAAFGQLSL